MAAVKTPLCRYMLYDSQNSGNVRRIARPHPYHSGMRIREHPRIMNCPDSEAGESQYRGAPSSHQILRLTLSWSFFACSRQGGEAEGTRPNEPGFAMLGVRSIRLASLDQRHQRQHFIHFNAPLSLAGKPCHVRLIAGKHVKYFYNRLCNNPYLSG